MRRLRKDSQKRRQVKSVKVAKAATGGRFAPNVKGEVGRVRISLFALQTKFTFSQLATAVLPLLFLRGFAASREKYWSYMFAENLRSFEPMYLRVSLNSRRPSANTAGILRINKNRTARLLSGLEKVPRQLSTRSGIRRGAPAISD
jgi:hypothetical protein